MSKNNNKKKKQVSKQENLKINTTHPIFNFIKPNDNDQFSAMTGLDLQDLLYYLDTYYLELRNRLGFHDFITFGLELEFENAMKERIQNQLKESLLYDSWDLKRDGSLHNGAEINSPILRDTKNSWKNLKTVCTIINQNASISSSSGGHIHIGTQVIGKNKDAWMNFIKLWSVYENIIYRFVYGDFVTARSSIKKYASPTTTEFWKDYQNLKKKNHLSLESIISKISHQRYQAVNFNNVSAFHPNEEKDGNTIEFRCPNSSTNPIVWQNNVNLFVNLLLYSKNPNFNDDIIQKRRSINKEKYASLNLYGEIYLQQALELCDLVFTNNFDKVYFLRQYLKSFETDSKELSKCKTFTKNL